MLLLGRSKWQEQQQKKDHDEHMGVSASILLYQFLSLFTCATVPYLNDEG